MTDVPDVPVSADRWRLAPVVEHVVRVQQDDGLVPWYPGGPSDPWDHVESAMGLTVGGRYEAAAAAYRWLADAQLDDGSWWATYSGDGEGDGTRRETHRSAYVAVGVLHHYRVTGDREFLAELWPTVERALEFALAHQSEHGEVFWAVGPDGEPYRDALVSGNASVFLSLNCGLAIARELGNDRPAWARARDRVATAIRTRDDRFDRTWASKANYAMYWFYPVLCGVLSAEAAAERLDARWSTFVEPGLGCRCVADEPWVTVAESSELVLSLVAAGRRDRAAELFDWLFRWTDEAGVFWTGYQFEDDEIWPAERPTWTAGAALLAADALTGLTPATDFFRPRR